MQETKIDRLPQARMQPFKQAMYSSLTCEPREI
jgi:hypothetical protein